MLFARRERTMLDDISRVRSNDQLTLVQSRNDLMKSTECLWEINFLWDGTQLLDMLSCSQRGSERSTIIIAHTQTINAYLLCEVIHCTIVLTDEWCQWNKVLCTNLNLTFWLSASAVIRRWWLKHSVKMSADFIYMYLCRSQLSSHWKNINAIKL